MKIYKYRGKYVSSFYNLLFFLCLPLSISGQNTILVKGIVEDQMHERMPGVTVSIPGTNTGTITDVNGCYSINVPNNTKELMFSFVGFQTLTVPIDGKQLIDVTMKEDAIALDELVVVGYGVQKKESSVAAITQVNGNALLHLLPLLFQEHLPDRYQASPLFNRQDNLEPIKRKFLSEEFRHGFLTNQWLWSMGWNAILMILTLMKLKHFLF